MNIHNATLALQIELVSSAKKRKEIHNPEAYALGGISGIMGIILPEVIACYPETKGLIESELTRHIERNTAK